MLRTVKIALEHTLIVLGAVFLCVIVFSMVGIIIFIGIN